MNDLSHLTQGVGTPSSGNKLGKTTTAAEKLVDGVSGQYFYLTDLIIINHDESAAVVVAIKSNTTTIFTMTLDAGQGFSHAFAKPVKFTVLGADVNVTLGSTAASPGVDVFINGFFTPVPK